MELIPAQKTFLNKFKMNKMKTKNDKSDKILINLFERKILLFIQMILTLPSFFFNGLKQFLAMFAINTLKHPKSLIRFE